MATTLNGSPWTANLVPPLSACDNAASTARTLSPSPSSTTLVPPSITDVPSSVPGKKGPQWYRQLRWNVGSVYRRLFTIVFLANSLVFLVLLVRTSSITHTACITAVTGNVLASLLFRNEHVVNGLFLVFTRVTSAPLWLRQQFAMVYAYGGIHSACGVAATFWFLAYLVRISDDSWRQDTISTIRGWLLGLSFVTVSFLVAILVFAYPRLRVRFHDWFEAIHRFLGWGVVILFWCQTVLLAVEGSETGSISRELVGSPGFWMLVITTLLVVYPWVHLRRRSVKAEPLSDHVIRLNFDYADVHYGQAVRLTDSPLVETHAFAVIPNIHNEPTSVEAPIVSSSSSSARSLGKQPNTKVVAMPSTTQSKGFSVLVSNAGDWTQKIIRSTPTQIWTRGLPQYGVLRVAGLFNPVIIVATGSGIGPCLSLFVEKPDHPVRIIWSTKNPVATYGQGVIDTILRADPYAIIHDTGKLGRPDLVAMVCGIWAASRSESMKLIDRGLELAGKKEGKRPMGPCEAVVIISNQKVTKKVVYGLESRGVSAYGAIFDS